MELKSALPGSAASPSPRTKKKRKRLDAICEKVYTRNHKEPVSAAREGAASTSQTLPSTDLELRRSSRVRRAPVLLDVSPPPVKKRKKFGKDVKSSGKKNVSVGSSGDELKEEDEGGNLETLGSWKSRLRARKRSGRNGRRKLFADLGDSLSKKVGSDDEELLVGAKAKRLGKVKAVSGLIKELKEVEVLSDDDDDDAASEKEADSGKDEKEVADDETDTTSHEDSPASEGETSVRNEGENGDPVSDEGMHEEEENSRLDGLKLEKSFDGADTVDSDEVSGFKEKGLEIDNDGENEGDNDVKHERENEEEDEEGKSERENAESDERASEENASGGKEMEENKVDEEDHSDDLEADFTVEMPLEDGKDATERKMKDDSVDIHCSPGVKQGRLCGLCGCGNDGKPPKRVIQEGGESEIEAYCGSSASEEPNYDVWDGFANEPGWLGRLLGPVNDRYGIAGIWVHQLCAVWSPEVYFAGLGCLKNVKAALFRGKALKCTRCGRPGATIGCRVDRCPRTYHLPCARATGCIFDHRKFLIACTDHRHIFQPQGSQYLMKIKKLKARKLKLEVRKSSNDAWRKDVEAEEKWLENCGEDEEFLKRESKRLHRDLARIAPVYIGGPGDSDSTQQFEGWESVAGLQAVIQSLKEVVILPLLYPEFFSNLAITPPRGVLLHGYPGTGKTLVVRALIGSCAQGNKKIAYFARKGADCLGKYVGDAERQLRLLFQVAEKCQPSIIFFDEIDGLAPCRTRQQDQTHSSVVSTLLALMDGLKSRGSVIVIGATNRPEAVDPALRRPGRFDREIYFPLPSANDRASILSVHTRRWPKPVSDDLLKWIAHQTVGFAGADLQALCTQASIISLKRAFPLQEVLSAAAAKRGPNDAKRLPLPSFTVEERDWLEALSCAPPPCSRREAGMASYDLASAALPAHLVPCLLHPLTVLIVSLYLDERLWLPPLLSKVAAMIEPIIIPSVEAKNLARNQWGSCISALFKEAGIAKEIQQRLSSAGILAGESGFTVGEIESEMGNGGTQTSFFQSGSMSFGSRKKSGFRVLIAGDPRCGQKHLAACTLRFFIGNLEIWKVDLATVSQEGQSDMAQGIMRILTKCSSLETCMLYLPRIDLWAIGTCQEMNDFDESAHQQLPEEEVKVSENSDEDSYNSSIQTASYAWNSFVEQVESLRVSTSLIILATSDIPYPELPHKVREFFNSDTSHSASALEHTVPRFCVHVEKCPDYESVVSLSAQELSQDMIHLFVQLSHHSAHTHTHTHTSSSKHNSAEKVPDVDDTCKNHESVQNVGPTPNTRSSKGKSNLLLAISTFGYQILSYPHFAELCWVTSKLRDGPCADVSGPWRIWPFNSCIIRPGNLSDKVSMASGSMKGREKSGFARGLIAVGLLAYRGVYKSVMEVSFEVRKVLELLMEQVNEKIQGGKDQYAYVRLLSQVAYLEDMVNNWAYGLLSLDGTSQSKSAYPSMGPDFPDHHRSTGEPNLPESNNHHISSLENLGMGTNYEANNGVADPDSNERATILADQSDQPIDPGMKLEDAKPEKHSGVCPSTELRTSSENGFCEPEKFVSEDQPHRIPSDNPDGRPEEQGGSIDLSQEQPSPDSRVLCSYHCCPSCLKTLHSTIQKFIYHEMESNDATSQWTAEDFHDLVASLSVNLLSSVRNLHENKRQESCRASPGSGSGSSNCECRAEHNCHAADEKSSQSTDLPQHSEKDLRLLMRDGILVPAGSESAEEDVSFHCKYETFCLCSIVDVVMTMKQPYLVHNAGT
ncbi:unnamed protein product [Linum tenue]|uniref:PHD-type domain-containing protein n=1 Tax=Linum tenue TaxID=586396 RepID=A0AAV0M3U9_9ROSI|nr:unnamed protein product [Linum tenue]